jgi:hypothetical protein
VVTKGSEVTIMHRFTTSNWETVETYVGVGSGIERYIYVPVVGFRLRKKFGPFGGSGNATPGCVNYGGTGWYVIQLRGRPGEMVSFQQVVGSC